jgi:hypothetical protein
VGASTRSEKFDEAAMKAAIFTVHHIVTLGIATLADRFLSGLDHDAESSTLQARIQEN